MTKKIQAKHMNIDKSRMVAYKTLQNIKSKICFITSLKKLKKAKYGQIYIFAKFYNIDRTILT